MAVPLTFIYLSIDFFLINLSDVEISVRFFFFFLTKSFKKDLQLPKPVKSIKNEELEVKDLNILIVLQAMLWIFWGSTKMVPLGEKYFEIRFDILFSPKVCRRKVNDHDRED